MEGKFGVIIQARTGSSRLPKKMTMPFGTCKSLLEFIIKRLQLVFPTNEIILATSNSDSDRVLVDIAKQCGVNHYCGSEQDVLGRFVDAANNFSLKHVLRVCADNPFLSLKHLSDIKSTYATSSCDYLSYQLQNGTPIMKSHVGFFTEVIAVTALEKAITLTQDPFYHEHVTNFVYGNPEQFKVEFLPIPTEIDNSNYRLTLDTKEDYDVLIAVEEYCRKHYTEGDSYAPQNVLKAVDQLNLVGQMNVSIKNNPK